MAEQSREPEEDRFGGAWIVAEYVHDPDGSFRGIVRQRRIVEPIGDARLRVTQICEPDAALAGHPMSRFAGEWVFDLAVAGQHRHYLGPDVVGLGTEWQPGAMTGSGMWPRFGHEFTSYGVLVAPDRQLTGGFFSMAGRPVADIVGVAVPESAGIAPTLDLSAPRPALAQGWPLHRAVGPMVVALDRPHPTEQRRRFAMTDTVGGVEMVIEQRQTFGDDCATTTEISITEISTTPLG